MHIYVNICIKFGMHIICHRDSTSDWFAMRCCNERLFYYYTYISLLFCFIIHLFYYSFFLLFVCSIIRLFYCSFFIRWPTLMYCKHFTLSEKKVIRMIAKTHSNIIFYAPKVWRNLTIASQGVNEYLFLSSSGLKSHFEGKFNLIYYIFGLHIF